jgi:hypothetical protein
MIVIIVSVKIRIFGLDSPNAKKASNSFAKTEVADLQSLKNKKTMSYENGLQGQVETAAAVAENLLTYADLLELEWVCADKIDEWIWRNDGKTDDSIEKSRATLGRIREMIRLDEKGEQS